MYPPFGSTGPYGTAYGNLGLFGALVAYGSLQLTESSPPQSFTEPLTVEEMAGYLRLPPNLVLMDQSISDELTGFLIAARELAEIHQNRDLVVKQWDLAFDYWPSYRVELRSPLVSVNVVQYKDSEGAIRQLVEDTDYVVDKSKSPALLAPPYNKTWPTYTPWPTSAMLIRFTSGFTPNATWWSDAGARVKIGMKLLVKSWFNKEALTPQQMEGIFQLLSQGQVPRAK